MRKGTGIAILNFGVLLDQALTAAETLGATVVDMRWVKPLDEAMILSLVEQHDLLITLEENAVAGGAGSGVAEFLANAGVICQVRHIGIPDAFIAHAGQGECRQLAGPRQLPTFTLPGMCDKGVGNADMAHLANNACVGEELGDAAPRTTSDGVFLQSDQQIMLFNQRENHCLIQRFHPAHVDHRCAQCFGGGQRLIQQYAEIQDGDAGPFSH